MFQLLQEILGHKQVLDRVNGMVLLLHIMDYLLLQVIMEDTSILLQIEELLGWNVQIQGDGIGGLWHHHPMVRLW